MSFEKPGPGLRAVIRLDETGQDCPHGEPLTPERLARRIERLNQNSPPSSSFKWKLTPQGWTVLGVVASVVASFLIRSALINNNRVPAVSTQNNNIPIVARRDKEVKKAAGIQPKPAFIAQPTDRAANNSTSSVVNNDVSTPNISAKQPTTKPQSKPKPNDKNSAISKRTTPPKRNPALPVQSNQIPGIINGIGMRFALIPAGEFRMGTDEGDFRGADDTGEKRPHLVRKSQPFYFGVFEVTRAEYRFVSKKESGFFKTSELLPIESVSWFDAIDFCNTLSMLERVTPYYHVESVGDSRVVTIPNLNGIGYRLPTEAEWEYACRATTQTPYSFGADPSQLDAFAWVLNNSGQHSHEVGGKSANQFGLHDMHGNVWEWCWDWQDPRFYMVSPEVDPMGPKSGTNKVRRGGSYDLGSDYSRSAFRAWFPPEKNYPNIGFRVARNVN